MADLYDYFRDLIQVGAGLGDMLMYFGTRMPSYLTVVLPLSMLLSLLFVLSKLHRNNELTAVRAAGLNIFATTRSLWLAGVALCAVSLLLNAKVVPWSVETSRSLYDAMQFKAEAATMPEGGALGVVPGVTFDNQRENRLWFINRYSRFSKTAYGIQVSQLDHSRREVSRIMAREGTYDPVHGGWTFKEGRELTFDPEQGQLVRPASFALKPMPDYGEDPTLMLLIDRKPQDLSFNELRRITEFFATQDNRKVLRYEVRYYSVLFETIGPLIIIAIAIPFAVSGVRVSPAVGVSKSIGLFFLYYVLTMLSQKVLGEGGYLEPMWAALMPNLAMTGLAAWLFGRMQ
jgi:lipopolysaccharide export system permease protein